MYSYNYLKIDDEAERAYLLGYDMHLTPSEFQVLKVVCKSNKGLKACDALVEMGKSELSRGNVAVHICSINKKALDIGDRKLILCDDNGKYYINEFM